VLLPGDIEAPAEGALVARWGEGLRSDVLVTPHHGSKTSSTDAFVASVHPRWVLYPVGYRNRYHHPHPGVRARYDDIEARSFASPSAGAIEVHLGPAGTVVSAYRQSHRRYWYTPAED
jgi:competence protein ComEC